MKSVSPRSPQRRHSLKAISKGRLSQRPNRTPSGLRRLRRQAGKLPLGVLIWMGTVFLTAQDQSERYEVLGRRAAEGQQCIVCRQAIEEGEVVEVRYKGRRFFVAEEMLAEFAREPDAYFAHLEARSALFDERGAGVQGLGGGWLWLGLYALAGVLSAAVCGYVAINKSLSPVPWFFAGLLGNAAAVAVILAVSPGEAGGPERVPAGFAKIPSTRSPAQCPSCGASLHPLADACSKCGGRMQPASIAETRVIAPASREEA